MSDASDHGVLPEDELLAAEYALGVLDDTERASAQRRVARDRGFAALVTAWEERLAPWAGEIDEIAPPPQVWEAIAAAVAPPARRRAGFWQNLAFWRGLALASVLAAACLGVVVYLGAVNRNAPLVAAINGGGHYHFVATVDAKHGVIAVVPVAFAVDPNRVAELWLIPSDGKPRAVGLLHGERIVTIALPPGLAALTVGNAVLAVSLEPLGGSPTGQPTGPVIATGKLENL